MAVHQTGKRDLLFSMSYVRTGYSGDMTCSGRSRSFPCCWFSAISFDDTNWIAAPFTACWPTAGSATDGATPPYTAVPGIVKDFPRIMKRERQKFAWYLRPAIVLLILYFCPGIWPDGRARAVFLFSAWMLAIQYCDYPFDTHKVPFKEMRTALRTRKITNMQFGALTSLFTLIPRQSGHYPGC
ncbi:sulfate transporter CysZ [Shigella flexneri]